MAYMRTVPNQRIITVMKQPCNAYNLFTTNNIKALDQAAGLLQSTGGFKLYMYMAKNQDKYNFALSSSDFMLWSGLGKTAYDTAFRELVDKGYLVLKEGTKTVYTFYDKPAQSKDYVTICNQPEKVEQVRKYKIISKG